MISNVENQPWEPTSLLLFTAKLSSFLENEDDPGFCIWEMHAAILLIIHKDLTKKYINKSKATIFATSVATPI